METEQNLKMELLTISEIGTAWKCEPVKLPQYCQLDFALTRQGKIEAFAEVKCRTFNRDRYKTSLIHLHKMIYARQVAFERDYGLMAEVPISEFHMVREFDETI